MFSMQRAHVSQAIMDVLTGKVTSSVTDFDESSDPVRLSSSKLERYPSTVNQIVLSRSACFLLQNSLVPISGSTEDGSRMEPLPPGME
jgi:hypothetical protein